MLSSRLEVVGLFVNMTLFASFLNLFTGYFHLGSASLDTRHASELKPTSSSSSSPSPSPSSSYWSSAPVRSIPSWTSAPVASWSKLVKCSNSKLIAKCYRSLSTLLRTSSHILTGLPTERAPLLSIEKWAGPAEYEGASSSTSSEKCSHFKKTSLLLLLLTGCRHISEEASEKVLEKSLAFLQNTIGKHQSNWFLKFISFCV